MPKKLIFDDELLRTLVADSTSFWQVACKLRPVRPNGCYAAVRRRIRELALDITHFTYQGETRARWTDEQLIRAVSTSLNMSEVLRCLGLIAAGGNFEQIKRRIKTLELSTAHFKPFARRPGTVQKPSASLDIVLVAGRWTGSHKLKQRLFRAGLKKPECELCGWHSSSADGRIPVELDHINGDRRDNRLENLRILCPNCHSLQPTHRGLNRGRASRAGRPVC